jgi:hypothetical protein
MKPFDLQKALAGEPVVTKQGDKIIQLHYFPNLGSEFKVIVHKEHSFLVDTYKIDGSYGDKESELDLIMSEPEQWVNVYWSGVYQSEADAKSNMSIGSKIYQTTIKIK